MKKLILLVVIAFVGVTLNAQDLFFPTKEGTVLVYKHFDKKDKVTSIVKYTIKSIKKLGDDMDITYLCEVNDAKDKAVYNEEITIKKRGDKMFFDMTNYMSKAAFQQNGQVPAELQVTGNSLEMPNNPTPGQTLPDASLEMAIKMGFVAMKTTVNVTNRKVEVIEDVTVGAGTFKAYKFSANVLVVTMGIKVNTASTDWYAKGVGIVKSIGLDSKGKQVSSMELVEMR